MKKTLLTLSILASVITVNAQTVSTIAGTGVAGDVNGPALSSQFFQPRGILLDAAGNIYFTDLQNQKIKKITPAGNVSTLSGTGSLGGNDGAIGNATYWNPAGMCMDANGNIYLTESGGNRIRFLDLTNNTVSLFAGSGSPGSADGTGAAASFNTPTDIDIDNNGNLYVADYNNNSIRVITPSGDVNTLATGISTPHGLVVDPTGSAVYVGSRNSHIILKITPAGVDTFAGNGVSGNNDGIGLAASFSNIMDLDMDALGNIYAISDDGHLRKIAPDSTVTSLVGNLNLLNYSDGIADSVVFQYSTGLAVKDSAHIFVTELNGQKIKEFTDTGSVSLGTIESSSGTLNILLFPNPTSGKCFIHSAQPFDHATVTVTDMIGKVVFETQANATTEIELKIDQSPGVYFVNIETINGRITKKFIKN